MRKENLQEEAVELIEQLSTEKLKVVINYLLYIFKIEEAWEATYELASQPEVVASLKRAEDDVKTGRLKSWGNVKRNV